MSDRDTKRQSETERNRYNRKGQEERMRKQRRDKAWVLTGLH